LTDCPALPKPVQTPGPPVIVGGRGPKRTPELAARYADEFNVPFTSVDQAREAYERVEEAGQRVDRAGTGRPPLTLSAGIVVAIGRTDSEARRRA
ncbi:LLM class flavin-dependent oxidoreductase, partial [Escherichia coli]|nr:LLM class flavin-dependent oxidoreductase [Escherichia coli]